MLKELVRVAGEVGVKTLCYNWMPSSDWTRTSIAERERGGCLVTAFDAAKPALATSGQTVHAASGAKGDGVKSADQLWYTLERFLREILPTCEACGVSLAIHPDDPPMKILNGKNQIIYSVAQAQKVVELVPSPANGICFCVGTFAEAQEDCPAAIRALGAAIKFVHFRDVVVDVEAVGPGDAAKGSKFREAWQDSGDTDMADVIRALKEIGFDGPIRPDHVPTCEGEDNTLPGYHVLGRLWALGYIKGLLDAV